MNNSLNWTSRTQMQTGQTPTLINSLLFEYKTLVARSCYLWCKNVWTLFDYDINCKCAELRAMNRIQHVNTMTQNESALISIIWFCITKLFFILFFLISLFKLRPNFLCCSSLWELIYGHTSEMGRLYFYILKCLSNK